MSYNIKELYKNPLLYGKNLDLDILEDLINDCNKSYFETDKQLISDTIYDILIDILEKRDPKNKLLTKIGIEIPDTQKSVKLNYHMGGMNKYKLNDNSKIIKWFKKYKGNYCISSKLDGISGLLEYNNEKITLSTRGDGREGKDITRLIKYLDLPNIKENITLRGELIVSKKNFEKYKKIYSNARSMVNGIRTQKRSFDEEIANNLEFIVFEVVKDKINIETQLKYAKKLGFKICDYKIWDSIKNLELNTNDNDLYKILLEFKDKTEYDIDGIIVTDNNLHEKNKSGNPEYSFAFKTNGIGQLTEVKEVEWNLSKHGKLVPRINVSEVIIDGSKIKFATGKNAKDIINKKIGKGSIVRIIRSGDVIPEIIEVIKEYHLNPLPENINYYWDSTNTNIFLDDIKNSQEYNHKQIKSFFRTLEIKNFGEKIIQKLIDNKYDSIKKIYNMSVSDISNIDGFKSTLSNKIYNNIHIILDNEINLETLMTASLKFGIGMGEKTFKSIINKYPDIMKKKITIELLNKIDGFSTITSTKFIKNFDNFKSFMNDNDFLKYKIEKKNIKLKIVGGLFENKKLLLTGFRDDILIDFIKKHNGVISNTFNNNINILIVSNYELNNKKVINSKLNSNITIISKDDFYTKYINS